MCHFIVGQNKEQRYEEKKDRSLHLFVICKLTTIQTSFILLRTQILRKQPSVEQKPKHICSVFHLRYINTTTYHASMLFNMGIVSAP